MTARARRALLVLLVNLSLAACGGSEGGERFSVRMGWPSALLEECANVENLDLMSAVLWIGGHPDCELAVDAATHEVSGSCEPITADYVRPLVLQYSLPSPAGTELTPIAFLIGWVDLTESAVSLGTDEVDVYLADDGTGLIVYDDNEVANFPDENQPSSGNPLEDATQWARRHIEKRGLTLDYDADGCPNFTEACEGTLSLAELSACP